MSNLNCSDYIEIERCPRQHSAKKTGRQQLGTFIHSVCLQVLRGNTQLDMQGIIRALQNFDIGDGEVNRILAYFDKLHQLPMVLVAGEHPIRVDIDGEEITGRVDAVMVDGEGNYALIDHKSGNVSYTNWKYDLQMRIYALWLRREYNIEGNVEVLIGDVMGGRLLSILFSAFDDEATIARIRELRGLAGSNREKYGFHCSWCNLKSQCKTFAVHTTKDLGFLDNLPLKERLNTVKAIIYNATKLKEEMENTALVDPEPHGFYVKTTRRRKVKPSILNYFGIPTELQGMLSVQIGGLDLWKRLNPDANIDDFIEYTEHHSIGEEKKDDFS